MTGSRRNIAGEPRGATDRPSWAVLAAHAAAAPAMAAAASICGRGHQLDLRCHCQRGSGADPGIALADRERHERRRSGASVPDRFATQARERGVPDRHRCRAVASWHSSMGCGGPPDPQAHVVRWAGPASRQRSAGTSSMLPITAIGWRSNCLPSMRAARSRSCAGSTARRCRANTLPNAVATLPHHGLLVISFYDPTDPQSWQRMASAQLTGRILQWQPGKGFVRCPMAPPPVAMASRPAPTAGLVYASSWSARKLVVLSAARWLAPRDHARFHARQHPSPGGRLTAGRRPAHDGRCGACLRPAMSAALGGCPRETRSGHRAGAAGGPR